MVVGVSKRHSNAPPIVHFKGTIYPISRPTQGGASNWGWQERKESELSQELYLT